MAIASLLLASSCGRHIGHYVWVDTYDDAPHQSANDYVISKGDLISVRVWNHDNLSGRVRVRSDGKISLPFVNDIQAAGLEPPALAARLQEKLKDVIVTPIVTVSLDEPAPVEVSVVGEVARPGVYRLDSDSGVLKALAAAGGLTVLAGRDRIFVLRKPIGTEPHPPVRIRFTYEALAHADAAAARFRLRSEDVVVVE